MKIGLLAVFLPSASLAATIDLIDITGPQNQVSTIGLDQNVNGTAVTFSLGRDITQASLSLDVLCVIGPCSGQFFLSMADVTNGSPSVTRLIDVSGFSTPTSFDGTQVFGFSDLALAAGTYSLQMTFATGLGGWLGTNAAQTGVADGFSAGGGIDYLAENPLLPQFSFSESLAFTPQFLLTGSESEPATVPLPASGPMLVVGLLLLWRKRL